MDYKIKIEDMMKAGLHLGHRTSKANPKMADFVIGIKNTVHVIDLEKTKAGLEKALGFLEELFKKKAVVLFVCTKTPLRPMVEEISKALKMPFVTERWLGGTITNFLVIKKRIDYYKDLLKQKESGEFAQYTKKERIKKEKDLQNLRKKFEGMISLEDLPDALFICDIVQDDLSLKEAKMKGIKTVAIVDTNADPNLVDFPIPANDDAISSVGYILDKIKEAMTQ